MKDLADQHIDKEVLKSLWLQRLPTNIQQILATFDGSIEELALKADTIMEISATNVDVNVVKVPDDGMQAAISDLTNRLDRLTRNNQRNFVRNDRSYKNNVSHPQRPVSSRQGSSTPKQDTLCWYHLSPPFKAATTEANTSSCRPYVRDKSTSLRFLIDTGVEVSVMPKHSGDDTQITTTKLVAANNTFINTY
ncbi:uncharacterized protein LOC118732751, partial [Rhagoletis pomonella]|uniref:uncharacterized protein LOC118732751 n=1 Tax=Rhagoletis pomonella TaxID=28610 RepID=UPI00177AAD0E